MPYGHFKHKKQADQTKIMNVTFQHIRFSSPSHRLAITINFDDISK